MEQVMLVLDETGLCVNAIVMGAGYSAQRGHRLVSPDGDAWIGWTLHDDGTWTPPAPDLVP